MRVRMRRWNKINNSLRSTAVGERGRLTRDIMETQTSVCYRPPLLPNHESRLWAMPSIFWDPNSAFLLRCSFKSPRRSKTGHDFTKMYPLFLWLVVVTLNGLTCWVDKDLSSLFSDVGSSGRTRTGAAITRSLGRFSCQTFQIFTRKRGQRHDLPVTHCMASTPVIFCQHHLIYPPPQHVNLLVCFGFSIISKSQTSHSICRYFAMHKNQILCDFRKQKGTLEKYWLPPLYCRYPNFTPLLRPSSSLLGSLSKGTPSIWPTHLGIHFLLSELVW